MLEQSEVPSDLPLRFRAGIASGKTAVGFIGGRGHLQYSAVGNPVNYALEYQRGCRLFGVDILTGTACLNAAESTGGNFISRNLGPMPIKGRSEPLEVFELVAVR